MFKINEEVLDKTLNRINNGVLSGDFRKCKLLGSETGYSSTDIPKFTLIYEVNDTREVIEDNFFFTEKSQSTVIERLNNAYKALTGLALNRDDFIPVTNLKVKFDSIVGQECGIREYLTKGGYTGYLYYLNNSQNANQPVNYGFWGEKSDDQNANNTITINMPTGYINSNSIKSINLDEELGGNQQ